MQKKEKIRRYIIFFFGLLFNSFGVAFVTKATLGTSPIAAIPYSISLIVTNFSLGNWVILFNVLLVLIQLILLRKDANKIELLLQCVIAFFFGKFIDISMLCLTGFLPKLYIIKIISLVIGCAIIAFGAYLEVVADVVMLPGDGFVRAIAKVLHKEYGGIRVISDISMTVIAGAICLVFLHQLIGVREGTIIAALITGNMIKLFSRKLVNLTDFLIPKKKESIVIKK